mgnify:FL=1
MDSQMITKEQFKRNLERSKRNKQMEVACRVLADALADRRPYLDTLQNSLYPSAPWDDKAKQ